MHRVHCLWLPVVILLTSACGSSSPTSPSTTTATSATPTPTPTPITATGLVTASIDGVPFAANAIQISRTGGAFIISAVQITGTTGTALAFGVLGTSAATYAIPGTGAQGGNNALLQEITAGVSTGFWTASASQGSGTITITSLTTSSAAGTFSLTLLPSALSGPVGVGTKNVTSGTFNVTF